MAEHKTRVFISHAEVNAEAAEQLAEGLRSESLDVWTYAMIGPGENWAAQVANALEQADAMVVLLTPKWVESEWVKQEIEYALSSKRFQHRLIPVVIGREHGTWLAKAPWVLKMLQMVTSPTPAKASKRVAEYLKKAG